MPSPLRRPRPTRRLRPIDRHPPPVGRSSSSSSTTWAPRSCPRRGQTRALRRPRRGDRHHHPRPDLASHYPTRGRRPKAPHRMWRDLCDPQLVPVATAAAELLDPTDPRANPGDAVWLPLYQAQHPAMHESRSSTGGRLRLVDLPQAWPQLPPPVLTDSDTAPTGSASPRFGSNPVLLPRSHRRLPPTATASEDRDRRRRSAATPDSTADRGRSGKSGLRRLHSAEHSALGDIPADRLALYQQAATVCPGFDWSILAAIGKIESDHGRSPCPASPPAPTTPAPAGPCSSCSPPSTP